MFVVYWPDISAEAVEANAQLYIDGLILNGSKLVIVTGFSMYCCKKRTIATVNFVQASFPQFTVSSNAQRIIPTAFSGCEYETLNVVLFEPSIFYSFPLQAMQFPLLNKIRAHFGEDCKRSHQSKLPLVFLGMQEGNLKVGSSSKTIRATLPTFFPLSKAMAGGWLAQRSHFIQNIREKLEFCVDSPVIYLDAMLGSLVALVLLRNCRTITKEFPLISQHVTITSYESLIGWLMGWPAGLKLNSNLNKFLGEMFLWMLNLWSHISQVHQEHFEILLFFVIFCSLLGMSTLCAALTDALNLFTVHLRFIAFVAAKIHRFQHYVMFALFQLFRGKKWNSLRHRYDAADYSAEQLLIGTILFTILAYLYPTVLTYFVPFFATKKCFEVLVVFMKIMQRACLKFPLEMFSAARQPHSVDFEPLLHEGISNANYFYLKSIPKSRSAILKEYLQQIICQ